MKRLILIVLDGFGIGAMDDVSIAKPDDSEANTCKNIFSTVPALRLPNLKQLGLGNAYIAAGGNISDLPPGALTPNPDACFGTHRLAHSGADTFWGHQELMGTKPFKPAIIPFSQSLQDVRDALIRNGHKVRFYEDPNNSGKTKSDAKIGVLIVDEAITIGDNLETDPGNNYNVTASLDLIPFFNVIQIGRIVRSLVRISRVIIFGGHKVTLNDLLNAFEASDEGYAGINAPKSGVYKEGYQVVHLGYGVDPLVQVPNCLNAVDIPTVLIGKVADIVENPNGKVINCVDTEKVLRITYNELQSMETGFICANVQETDLAGHREDSELYAHCLEIADTGIGRILGSLGPDDLLIVTADHGNDPEIGHSKHTRELTPLLVGGNLKQSGFLGERLSLADTGATVSAFFGAPQPQFGENYLNNLISAKEIYNGPERI